MITCLFSHVMGQKHVNKAAGFIFKNLRIIMKTDSRWALSAGAGIYDIGESAGELI